MPEYVEADLKAEWLWPHRKKVLHPEYDRRDRYDSFGHQLPRLVTEAVALFLGRVGDLLKDHEFLDPWHEDQKRWDTQSIHHTEGPATWRHKLRALDKLPDQLTTTYKEYASLEGPLFKTYGALEDQRRQKAQLEAKKLWDQA